MRNDYTSDYLAHHGILGMRWGRKNGPPYPLGASDHSQSEKKAGYRKSLGGGRNEELYDRKDKESGGDSKKKSGKSSSISDSDVKKYREELLKRGKNLDYYKNASDDDLRADIERQKKMAKTILVASAAIGVSAAVYVAYRSGVFDRISSSIKQAGGIDKVSEQQLSDIVQQASKLAADDIGLVLDSKTTLHRMSAYGDFSLDKIDSPLYVTYKDLDRKIYAAFLKDWSGTGERYDVSLGIKGKITAPSEKKMRQIIEELYKDNSFIEGLAKTTQDFYVKMYGDSYKGDSMYQVFLHQIMRADKNEQFEKAVWSIVRRDNTSKRITDAVKNEGFNAIIDFFDKDTMSEMPLIVLDAKKDLVYKGKEYVSAQTARRYLREIVKRRYELPKSIRDGLGI